MFFPLPNNPTLSLTLNNLLLVPHITKNLMSVSKFAQDNNVFFEFHPKFCVVRSQASSEVLLRGSVGSDGLYKFPNPATQLSKLSSSSNSSSAQSISKTKCSASCNVSCSSVAPTNHVSNCLSNCIPQCITPCNFDQYNNNTMSSFSNSPSLNYTTYNTELTSSHSNSSSSIAKDKYVLWHTRLGNPNHHAFVEVFKLCNLPILPKPSTELCHACCLGKSHRLPFTLSTTVYTHPFELVVCDLWGPAPMKSTGGYTYFLTCVDAFSRFVWVTPLRLKSDTLTQFIQFKKMVELQFNCLIKCVQSDGGGEFRPFTKYLTELGIVHRFTCPHTHHQNGLVERKHRHIVETGLTLLAQSTLPLKFWDHAFVTTTYLINRLPSPTLDNCSPYSKLLHKPPDYSTLKVFGCSCYPFLRPYNSHKLTYRSKECLFLGYSTAHKGYKCLAADGHIYISKDVVFDESHFPYSTLFPAQSSNSGPSSSSPITPSWSAPSLPFSLAANPVDTPSSSTNPSFVQATNHTSSGAAMSSPSVASSSSPVVTPSSGSAPILNEQSAHDQPSTSASTSPPCSLVLILSDIVEASTISPSSSQTISPSPPHQNQPFVNPHNMHSMQTRAKRGIVQPKRHPTLLLTHLEPTSVLIKPWLLPIGIRE